MCAVQEVFDYQWPEREQGNAIIHLLVLKIVAFRIVCVESPAPDALSCASWHWLNLWEDKRLWAGAGANGSYREYEHS